MPHIFISYAKNDTRILAERLFMMINGMEGFTAWMDNKSLEAAESWALQIQDEIYRADMVLVLLSPDVNRRPTATQRRSFVLNEIDFAQQLHKPILPILAQQTISPVQIAGVQYIDFTQHESLGIEKLIIHLQKLKPGTHSYVPVAHPEIQKPVRQSESIKYTESSPPMGATNYIASPNPVVSEINQQNSVRYAKNKRKNFIFPNLIVNAVSFAVMAYLVIVRVDTNIMPIFVLGAIMTINNVTIRSILSFISFPITILTIGLIILLTNVGLLVFAGWVSGGMLDINGLWSAILGGLIMAIANMGLQRIYQ